MQLTKDTARRAGRALALAGVLAAALGAADAQAAAAGRVTQLHGRATVASPEGNIRLLRRGAAVAPGDTINTSPGSFAKLRFKDGGSIFLRPSSRFRVDAFEDSGGKKKTERSFFSLLKGGMRFVTGLIAKRNRAAYRLSTPTATIGIRGTDAIVRVCAGDCPQPDGTYTLTLEGATVLSTPTGEIESVAGQAAFVGAAAGSTPGEADPEDTPMSGEDYPSPESDEPAQDCLAGG